MLESKEEKTIFDHARDYLSNDFSPIALCSLKLLENGCMTKEYFDEMESVILENLKSENPLTTEEMVHKSNIKGCKLPIIHWEKYLESKPTEEEVRMWFDEERPTANIGLMTGRHHNLLVFDVEDQKAHEYAESKGGFPITPVVITNKGLHYYFKCPTDYCQSITDERLGIKVLGDGGYVVAPPSINSLGKKYQWKPGQSIYEVELAECNSWMLELLKEHQEKRP